MLRILGSHKRACDGVTRRELLTMGGLGLASLAAGSAFSLGTSGALAQPLAPVTARSFGRAKRVVLLYLYGAAAQHETFDPKPEAPVEIRGTFNSIPTALPSLRVCEHLPRIARMADRLTVVRSMSHPYNIHSAAYTLTGIDRVDIPMELNPADKRHWPFFASVLDYLKQRGAGTGDHEIPATEIPANLALPFRFSSRSPEFTRGGPYGGFLGRNFDPVWTEVTGTTTGRVNRWRGERDVLVEEPFIGVSRDAGFRISQASQLGGEITLDRLERRRSLLDQLDTARRRLETSPEVSSMDRCRKLGYSLIGSGKVRSALDLERELPAVRERYGYNLFGQATLAARRLLEAGAPVVSVFWDEITTANSAWDTHFDHYERLQTELLPGLDAALSSLVLDLEERGMLDDTIVLCLTEHGRTPKFEPGARGGGRGHWSDVYSIALAGGGFARGRVVGVSDKQGAFVKDRPMSPKDILATVYHLLGVDPRQTIPDQLGRPLPLVSDGEVLADLLA